MDAKQCKTLGCSRLIYNPHSDYCTACIREQFERDEITGPVRETKLPMSLKYPQYYKQVGELKEVDVYAVHHLFNIQDPSGALQHASKKLLLSGVRTGGKSAYDDIKEARDTLTRWLELNQQAPQ